MVKFKLRSPFTWERNLLRIGVVPAGPIRTVWGRDKSRAPEKYPTAILAKFDIVRVVLLNDLYFGNWFMVKQPKKLFVPLGLLDSEKRKFGNH